MEDSTQKRLRSPRRDRSKDRGRPRERKQTGFRWKDKTSRADDGDDRRNLQRGYRDRSRSPRRDRDAARDSYRDRERRGDRDRDEPPEKKRRERSPAREEGEVTEDPYEKRKKLSQGGDDSAKDARAAKTNEDGDAPVKKKKEKKTPKPAAPAVGQEMIIVHINDRMGTKAAIPCLPSDPVKMFKIMVGARIGREPHEILIKRQGERPFKDQLTLADYGVSNGVQLDLEVDTSG